MATSMTGLGQKSQSMIKSHLDRMIYDSTVMLHLSCLKGLIAFSTPQNQNQQNDSHLLSISRGDQRGM